MTIKTAPIFSGKVYLGDISPDVKDLEGDCADDERAWIMARQATEADNMNLNAFAQGGRTIWTDDGVEQRNAVTQSEIRVYEVFLTLTDAGNFDDDKTGKELLQFATIGSYNKVAGEFQEFKERYGTLPRMATSAVSRAIYTVNPDWDLSIEIRHDCPNCGHIFEPSRATRHKEGEVMSG